MNMSSNPNDSLETQVCKRRSHTVIIRSKKKKKKTSLNMRLPVETVEADIVIGRLAEKRQEEAEDTQNDTQDRP